jgi:hypothetical protein
VGVRDRGSGACDGVTCMQCSLAEERPFYVVCENNVGVMESKCSAVLPVLGRAGDCSAL